jgi:hypothetical protein
MKRFLLMFLMAGAALAGANRAQAQQKTTASSQNKHLEIICSSEEPKPYCILKTASNNFTLVIPPGFQASLDQQSNILKLKGIDTRASIQLFVRQESPGIDKKMELRRMEQYLEKNHSEIKKLDEPELSICSIPALGFEFEGFLVETMVKGRIFGVSVNGEQFNVYFVSVEERYEESLQIFNQFLLGLKAAPAGQSPPKPKFLLE